MSLSVILNVLVHCIFLVTGLIGNIFILTVHFLDWLTTSEHNPCNLILNGIGISNIFLQGTVVFQEITFFIYPDFYFKDWVIYMVLAMVTTFSFSSLWCSTCLCFYYCVKIVNLQGTFFYKIKANLSNLVPWLLAFSIVLSWSAGLPAYWDLYLLMTITTLNITGNITTVTSTKYWSRCNCLFHMYICIASAAFIIISVTGGTIIISLCKHMSRMRQNNEGFGHARINTHLSAAKTVTLLLVIYLLFYGSFTLIYNPLGFPDDVTMTICLIILSCFPSINSIILISGNRKLTNFVKKLFGIQPSVGNTEVNVTNY
ncbi:taste receptor type 2 member 40-like [Hyla sarda]|uniref:taste receptor type 2 member 40-like n=1 Tax=Hyla sarda TaxID=327740 RepID=UPI0024C42E6F|nr:taste receptor type 2 member 40-like [Hyla sarda]